MNAILSRRALFFAVAITVFALVLVYPTLRLQGWLGIDAGVAWLVALAIFFAVFVIRAVHERWHSMLSRRLTSVSMTWVGISFIALCLTVPAELWVLLGGSPPHTAQFVLWFTVGLSVYGFYNANRLTSFTLDVNAPDQLRGLTLAQISDVHIGSRLTGLLPRIVARTNAMQPDYVVITGDLIDMRDIAESELQSLQQLEAPVLFCTGNHERYVDLEAICQRLTNLGVNVLRNTVYRPQLHPALTFFSIDDAESKSQVAEHLPALAESAAGYPDSYRILLYHRPDGADVASQHDIDLMLTGHTHRGQIVPFNFLVKRVFPEYYRSYQQDRTRLYVSPGTGTWGPVLRLGSKCEITLIRLL